MSTELQIYLFGSPKIVHNQKPLPPFLTQKSCELFGYLSAHPNRSHSRITLAGLLWPETTDEKARASLSTELWRLRRVLGDLQNYLILTRDEITFSFDSLQIDIHLFNHLTKESDYQSLKQAVELYQQDFMEGFYADWCVLEREQLRISFLQTIEKLLSYHENRGEWGEAISFAKKLLGYDPLREELHRTLMKLYVGVGDRPAALAQYQICVETLQKELQIQPMPETKKLFEQIQHTQISESVWQLRVPAANEITNQKLSDLTRSRRYTSNLFINRPILDETINNFIHTPVAGLIILSPSGYGKTTWLAHLAKTHLEKGDLVLFYEANSLTLTFERDITRHLWGTDGVVTTSEAMLALGRDAKKNDKKIWILIDGANSFHDLGASPADFLRRLNQLIETPELQHAIQNENCSIKVVITCRDYTWRQITQGGYFDINWTHYFSNAPVYLDKFNEEELSQVIEKYNRYFSVQGLSTYDETPDFYKNPLLLRLVYETWSGGTATHFDSETSLFREYILKVIPHAPTRQVLVELIGWISAKHKTRIYLSELQEFANDHHINLFQENSFLKTLLDAGIWMTIEHGLDQVYYFMYDHLFEYLLTEYILAQLQKQNDDSFVLLGYAGKISQFLPLYGALTSVLLLRRNEKFFLALAVSDFSEARELCVDSLAILHKEDPPLALSIAKQILNLDSVDAKQVALKVVPNMGEEGFEIFYSTIGASSETIRRLALISFDQLWRQDFQRAVHIMNRLIEDISPQTVLTSPRRIQTLFRIIGWFSNYDVPREIFAEIDHAAYVFSVEKLKLPTSESQSRFWSLIKNILARNTISYPSDEDAVYEIVRPNSLSENEQKAFRQVISTLRRNKEGIQDISLENIKALLQSQIDPARYPAHHQLALWIHEKPNEASANIYTLFDDLNGHARLWLLMAFLPLKSIQLKYPFPNDALNVLEELTARFAEENEEEFLRGVSHGALQNLGKVSFLPLGMRYLETGKTDFPLLSSLLGLSKNTPEKQAAILSLIEPLGWSHPHQVLNFLSHSLDFDLQINPQILKTLGSIRIFHPNTVDSLLQNHKIEKNIRQQIRLLTDIEKTTRQARLIATQDVRLTSILLGSPYGLWLTDCVMLGYLESKTPKEAAHRFGEGLFETLRQCDWHLKRLFGIPN